jgi:hypothetical protein
MQMQHRPMPNQTATICELRSIRSFFFLYVHPMPWTDSRQRIREHNQRVPVGAAIPWTQSIPPVQLPQRLVPQIFTDSSGYLHTCHRLQHTGSAFFFFPPPINKSLATEDRARASGRSTPRQPAARRPIAAPPLPPRHSARRVQRRLSLGRRHEHRGRHLSSRSSGSGSAWVAAGRPLHARRPPPPTAAGASAPSSFPTPNLRWLFLPTPSSWLPPRRGRGRRSSSARWREVARRAEGPRDLRRLGRRRRPDRRRGARRRRSAWIGVRARIRGRR